MNNQPTATMPREQNQSLEQTQAEVILLGIDVHVGKYVVSRQIDGLTPQPAQIFRDEGKFLAWVGRQLGAAERVAACYEAGPTGFALCRKIRSMGVRCHVVVPTRWAADDGGVKTDRRDAHSLCQRLATFEAGNTRAFRLVHVPTGEQERRRALSRQRELLKRDRQRIGQRGRMQSLFHGVRLKGRWWGPRRWAALEREHPFLGELLGCLQRSLAMLDAELKKLSARLESEAPRPQERPKGLGALSWRTITAEFVDPHRFGNRRQVGSFTGLCPREWSSGGRRRQGHVSKHGNALLRQYLVESVWRLIRWQPGWHVWKKHRTDFQAAGAGRRKQLVAAMARQLAIDLWRLETAQSTLGKLGLQPAS